MSAEIYLDQEIVKRNYNDVRISAASLMRDKALSILCPDKASPISLGGDWTVVKRKDKALYLESTRLNLFCEIEVRPRQYGSDKREYVMFSFKNKLVLDEDSDDEKEIIFDLKKNKIESLFRYRNECLLIPSKEINSMPTPEAEIELKKLTDVLAKKYPTLNIEDFDLHILKRLAGLTTEAEDQGPPYMFLSRHQAFSLASELLELNLDTSKVFDLDEEELSLFKEENTGKFFSAGFDYLFNTLNKLGICDEKNSLNFNDADDNVYLLTVAGKQILCSTSQNGGWLTVKGEEPGSWQCYNILEPYNTPEKLMALGPNVLKPSVIIENYELKSFDSFIYYCQYAIWGGVREAQVELIEKGLLTKGSYQEPEELIPLYAQRIEVENAIKQEKKEIDGVISKNKKQSKHQKL